MLLMEFSPAEPLEELTGFVQHQRSSLEHQKLLGRQEGASLIKCKPAKITKETKVKVILAKYLIHLKLWFQEYENIIFQYFDITDL